MIFTNGLWEEITSAVAASFRLTQGELDGLRNNPTARLLAAIPYLAGCDHPKRTAAASLGVFLMAGGPGCEGIFGHTPEDDADPFRRMFHAVQYSGGDQAVIERGNLLLALVQLKDHWNDREEDAAAGLYNPINSGAWQYESMYADLVSRITAIPCPEMDAIMPAGDETPGWWTGG